MQLTPQMKKQDHLYFRNLETTLNEKLANAFKHCKLKLRVKIKDHFVDRIHDRNLEINKARSMIVVALNMHICEIIFWSLLENKPERLLLKYNGYYIGCTISPTGVLMIRTIINNYSRRPGLEIPEYIIDLKAE
jgi:hypothetical protein